MKKIFLITGLGILGLGILGLGAVIFGLVYFDGQAKTEAAQFNDRVRNRYIVVLRSDEDPRNVANALSKEYGLTVGHVYKQTLKGFSATIPADKLAAVRNDPRVAYMEPDIIASINGPELEASTWRRFRQRLDQASDRLRGAVNNFLASEW